MPADSRDPALVDALADTIDFELRSQLALAGRELDPDEIKGIAFMVADQVLTEFEVRPRAERPALG